LNFAVHFYCTIIQKKTSIPLTFSIHSRIYASPLNNSKCTVFRRENLEGAFTARGSPSFFPPITGKYSQRPSRAKLMYLCLLFMSRQPARARFSLQPLDADETSGNIRRTRGSKGAETPRRAPEIQKPSRNGNVSASGSPFAKEIKRFRAICSDAKREAHVRQSRRLTFASYRVRRLPSLGVDYALP